VAAPRVICAFALNAPAHTTSAATAQATVNLRMVFAPSQRVAPGQSLVEHYDALTAKTGAETAICPV